MTRAMSKTSRRTASCLKAEFESRQRPFKTGGCIIHTPCTEILVRGRSSWPFIYMMLPGVCHASSQAAIMATATPTGSSIPPKSKRSFVVTFFACAVDGEVVDEANLGDLEASFAGGKALIDADRRPGNQPRGKVAARSSTVMGPRAHPLSYFLKGVSIDLGSEGGALVRMWAGLGIDSFSPPTGAAHEVLHVMLASLFSWSNK